MNDVDVATVRPVVNSEGGTGKCKAHHWDIDGCPDESKANVGVPVGPVFRSEG